MTPGLHSFAAESVTVDIAGHFSTSVPVGVPPTPGSGPDYGFYLNISCHLARWSSRVQRDTRHKLGLACNKNILASGSVSAQVAQPLGVAIVWEHDSNSPSGTLSENHVCLFGFILAEDILTKSLVFLSGIWNQTCLSLDPRAEPDGGEVLETLRVPVSLWTRHSDPHLVTVAILSVFGWTQFPALPVINSW